jgi:hypothetical protein
MVFSEDEVKTTGLKKLLKLGILNVFSPSPLPYSSPNALNASTNFSLNISLPSG